MTICRQLQSNSLATNFAVLLLERRDKVAKCGRIDFTPFVDQRRIGVAGGSCAGACRVENAIEYFEQHGVMMMLDWRSEPCTSSVMLFVAILRTVVRLVSLVLFRHFFIGEFSDFDVAQTASCAPGGDSERS